MYPYMQNQQQDPQQPVNPLPQQMAHAMLMLQQQQQQQQPPMGGMPPQQMQHPQMPPQHMQAQPQPGGLLSPITDYESLKLRAMNGMGGGLFGFGNQ